MEETKNKDLLTALHEAASLLSFYNAAEGRSWEEEMDRRGVASANFYALKEEAMRRGVYSPDDFKNYLV